MSVNLMEMVKGAVTDQVMQKIGGLLGQNDTKKTQSMFETAAGSILGGMMKKSSTPSGANDIFKSVQDHDDGVLDRLGDLLGGGKEQELMNSGNGVLEGVFGSNRTGMIGTIAKTLGLDSGIMGKLLSLAAPIVMGVIGRHVKSKALDAVGLGNLLGQQKSSLGSLLPSGLSGSLGFGDMLGSAGDAVKGAMGAAGDAAGNVGSHVSGAASSVAGAASNVGGSVARGADEAASGLGSLLKFLLPLILLGALAFFGYKAMNSGEAPADPDAGVAASGENMEAGSSTTTTTGFDLSMMQEKFSGVTSAFENGVTMDSAGSLAEKITELTGSIGNMGIGNLEGAAKDGAMGAIGNFKDTITNAMGSITDNGILGVLKPAVEKLMEVLGAFQ